MQSEGNGREQSTLASYNQEFIIGQSLVKPAPIRVGDHTPRAEGYKVRHADTLLMLTVLSLQVCLVMITKQN